MANMHTIIKCSVHYYRVIALWYIVLFEAKLVIFWMEFV